jgi:hypothetical protein
MQIREKTAEEWAAEEHVHLFTHFQMLDPVKNAHAGTWYLRKLLRRYPRTDNALPYALADYNAGRARVLQWSNNGAAATNSAAFLARMDYPGTRRYVQSVMKRYQHYRPIFPPKNKRLGLLSHRGAGSDTSATTVNHCVTPPTTMFRLSYFYTISYDARPIHYLSREHQSPHFPAVVFGIQTALVFWDSCEKTLRCVGSRRSAPTKGDGAQASTYVDSGSRRLNFPPELGLSFLAAVGLAICLVSNWTRSSAVAHPIR